MAGQQRIYRQRIRSTQSLKKMFRAQELIAASRIGRARDRMASASPYARAITRAVSAVATHSDVTHPLLAERDDTNRVAVLLIASDRGMAGAYSASVIRETERLIERLEGEGKEVALYVSGRRAESYYRFRQRELAAVWTGQSDAPTSELAEEIASTLLEAFGAAPAGEHEALPLYDFEPDAAEVLDALLPRYVRTRIFACLLQAAASELAARQRAMHTATENAEDLIRTYTRLANQARQAEITQEISEIVSGADALAS